MKTTVTMKNTFRTNFIRYSLLLIISATALISADPVNNHDCTESVIAFTAPTLALVPTPGATAVGVGLPVTVTAALTSTPGTVTYKCAGGPSPVTTHADTVHHTASGPGGYTADDYGSSLIITPNTAGGPYNVKWDAFAYYTDPYTSGPGNDVRITINPIDGGSFTAYEVDSLSVVGAEHVPNHSGEYFTTVSNSETVLTTAYLNPLTGGQNPNDLLTWDGGEAASGPLTRRLSRSVAGSFTISASCGTSTQSVTIHVVKIVGAEWGPEVTEANNHPTYPVGKKYDPSSSTPGGTLNSTISFKAEIYPKIPGVKVFAKIIDPDDPSDDPVIDVNGSTGGDNLGAGTLVSSSGLTDDTGFSTLKVKVSSFAGDNFRVGVSIKEADLSAINNDNVPPSDLQLDSFKGKLTGLLTIWRTLNLETASMDAKPTYNFPDDNIIYVSSVDYNLTKSTTTIHTLLASSLQEVGHYQGGHVSLGGTTYPIIENTANAVFSDSIVLDGLVPASAVSAALNTDILIHDDDSTTFHYPYFYDVEDDAKLAYRFAYIDLKNFGEHTVIPFKTELSLIDITLGTYETTPLYTSSQAFWTTLLITGYQIESGYDLDPDTNISPKATLPIVPEGASLGITVIGHHVSLYAQELYNDPGCCVGYCSRARTVAHEIGHSGGLNHYENVSPDDITIFGLMQAGGADAEFRNTDIKILRSKSSW